MIKQIIESFESKGAEYVKVDDEAIYFKVPQDCELNSNINLSTARHIVNTLLKLELKIKHT